MNEKLKADLDRRIADTKSELARLNEMLAEISGGDGEPEYVPVADLVKEQHDWAWLVGGVVGKGTTGMLVADPHVGKSTLAIQLCLGLAAGHNTLGWRVERPARVLYAFAEGARALVAERARTCMKSMGMPKPPSSAFVQAPCFSDFDVTSPGFRRLISQTKPDFAVLDALGYFFKGNENSAVEWKQQMMAPLRELTNAHGTTFLIIHHQTKESEFRKGWQKGRGTSAMFADVDFYFRLEYAGEDVTANERILYIDKNKYGSSGYSVNLIFDKAGACFRGALPEVAP